MIERLLIVISKRRRFITPSSELIDEIGFSAMAIEDFNNAVYSYHIMRLRIQDKQILNPFFKLFICFIKCSETN